MADSTSDVVVNTDSPDTTGQGFGIKKYGSAIVIIGLIILIMSISYCKTEPFTSPDGVAARNNQPQVRSDPEIDRKWNLQQLEKSVALINRQTVDT
jgi:hypothetical protein